jgi:thiamine biosynthesis lipoprotein
LFNFDLALSTYRDASIISEMNATEDSLRFNDPGDYFVSCYDLSQDIYAASNGAFDPSIMPLVDAWGFYKNRGEIPSDAQVDSLKSLIGFERDHLHNLTKSDDGSYLFVKMDQRFRLDFNAVAQGHSVDVVADFLRNKGAKNFYVEIGGEIVVSGKNREGGKWRIGIDSPELLDSIRLLDNIIAITDRAVATSGNYRNFYEVDGKKYAHTIDPATGRPVQHNLLSATLVCASAGEADAWATAFMVMGLDRSKQLLQTDKMKGVEAYFIYDDGKGKMDHWMTKGFSEMISKE